MQVYNICILLWDRFYIWRTKRPLTIKKDNLSIALWVKHPFLLMNFYHFNLFPFLTAFIMISNFLLFKLKRWNKFHLSTTILYYHFITSIFEIYWLFCVISLKRFFTFQNISFISGRDLWQYESMRFDYKWILPSNTARDTLLGMLESFCSNSNNIILSLWFLKTIDFFV